MYRILIHRWKYIAFICSGISDRTILKNRKKIIRYSSTFFIKNKVELNIIVTCVLIISVKITLMTYLYNLRSFYVLHEYSHQSSVK